MLQMNEINKIKKASNLQEKSRNEIALEFRRSWATVDKYTKATSFELKDRGKRSRNRTVVTDEVINKIKEFIDDEILRNVNRKQRYTSVYIFKRLKMDGIYSGSERQIRKHIRAIREEKKQLLKKNPSFLELHFKHGHYLQFDHGEATLVINGIEIQGYLFTASAPGLVLRYCQFFQTKEGLSWAEFHENTFKYFGGVFENCMYDNDSALVVPSTREHTKIFNDVMAHYDFKVILCNKAAGWEKGSVENSVGYCRRNFLAGKPEFKSMEEINSHLEAESRKDTAEGKHYQTGEPLSNGLDVLKTTLKELKPAHEWFSINDMQVDSQQTVKFKRFRYSVPEKFVGSTVKVLTSISKIKIFDMEDKLIHIHSRHYLEEHDSLVIEHYYDQLARKPGAFNFAKVVHQHQFSTDLQNLQGRLHTIKEKLDKHPDTEFIEVLKLRKGATKDEFEMAIKLSLSYGGVTSNAVGSIIRQLQIDQTPTDCPIGSLSAVCQINIENDYNLEQYNQLL